MRVLIADDHYLSVLGLRRALEDGGLEVVGETSDGHKVVSLVRELAPDVAVIDLRMGDISGLELLGTLRQRCPQVAVVILTVSDAPTDVIACLAGGAAGYLLKDSRADQLAEWVREAGGGRMALSPPIASVLVEYVREHFDAREDSGLVNGGGGSGEDHLEADPGADLTPRELEVLRLIAEGADNAAIGRTLSVSPHTVKQYVANIFEKLGVRNRVQAAVYAVRNGLV